ncbi:hypothetical protein CAEBREN_15372 [Caenorhabditis brenneri]|uniref:7TM GPCR serpentine receptor class x (Srx) domain-containing protein n=1 Tax=Caenorhabditis brenneri TaxID=135651 RepID=G0MH58_CAEBE|nr:hypothetical protein CAEBREN_15372 [Caenorhabditis brenneri]
MNVLLILSGYFLFVINVAGITAHIFVGNVVRRVADRRFFYLYLGSSIVNIVHSCFSLISRLPIFINGFTLFLPIELRVFYIWLTALQQTIRGLLCCHRFLKYKRIEQGNFMFSRVFVILILVSLGPPATLYFQVSVIPSK